MVAFTIFGRKIYRYGIFYLIGFLFAYFVFFLLGRKQFFKNFKNIHNLITQDLDSLFIIVILGVLIGGRLGHFLIYDFDNILGNWIEFFKVWHGGMSFIGGFLGVLIGVSIFMYVKKLSVKEIFVMLDVGALIIPLCIALGRFGNFLNQELYGIVFENSFGLSDFFVEFFTKIGILHVYPMIDSNLRINTNFLSIIFEGLLLFVIILFVFKSQVKRRKRKVGFLGMIFLIGYSVARFFLEYLRNDSQAEFVGLFSKSQRFFLVFIICGIVGSVIVFRRKSENL